MFIGGAVALVLWLWMIVRIGKQSFLLGVLAFVFWPVLFFAVFKYWGDEESDIKVPFAIFLLAVIYSWYDMAHMVKPSPEDQETLLGIVQLFA
jgi:hypothetical protein